MTKVFTGFVYFLVLVVCGQNCGGFKSGVIPAERAPSNNQALSINEISADEASSCKLRQLSARSIDLATKFDRYDKAFNNGLGYTGTNNLKGILAHSESHWMDSYLVMFEATNNEKYIRQAILHADRVLSQRDNKINVSNWRGEKLGIWSRNDHSRASTGPFPHLVEQGLITSPIAQIAALIKTTPCLQKLTNTDGRSFTGIAQEYIVAVNEVIAFNQPDWHTDTIGGKTIGWYTTPNAEFPEFPLPANQPPPINYVTAMAETLVHMYVATGDASYRARAEMIANWMFKDFYYTESTDAYWHKYWPEMTYYPDDYTRNDPTPEDFGHLTYTMGFMNAAIKYKLGIFDDQISSRIAHTLTRNMYQAGKGGFVFGMDGSGGEISQSLSSSAPYWAGFYLFLHRWDPAVVSAVEFALFKQKNIDSAAPSTEGMYSLAEYILYLQSKTPASGSGSDSGGKKCPWGGACSSDADCISDNVEHFAQHSGKVLNKDCYTIGKDGSLTNSNCLRDPPTVSWIGDFWIYSSGVSSSYGVACETPNSQSVWTWGTNNRTLAFCARKYPCR